MRINRNGYSKKIMKPTLVLVGIAILLLIFAARARSEESASLSSMTLFGAESTSAYPLTRVQPAGSIERWHTVLQRHREDDAFASGNTCMSQPMRKQWEALNVKFPQMSPLERLQAINAFFNLVPIGKDLNIYGQEEYWAYPAEFFRKSIGDCEDIAIAKYFALRHLNWPKNDLWLVLIHDLRRKTGHAVVAARHKGSIFILDNLSRPRGRIVPHEAQAAIYSPILALNETSAWVF